MTTRYRCNTRSGEAAAWSGKRRGALFALKPAKGCAVVVVLTAVCAAGMGCGYTGGQALYFLGVGRAKKVDAQFTLTKEPILILVDDYEGLVDWPPARGDLADELGQQLLEHKAAAKIVPPRTLVTLRQSDPKFDRTSARQIGERAGARQVLHVQVRGYLVAEQFEDVAAAAQMAVTVKVIDVEAKSRSSARLWPPSSAGRLATVNLDGATVARVKTKAAISRTLTDKLARHVARLFYTHRLDDFENEE